jgi:hypothetical protein
LPGTDALAYYGNPYIATVISFMIQAQGLIVPSESLYYSISRLLAFLTNVRLVRLHSSLFCCSIIDNECKLDNQQSMLSNYVFFADDELAK